jgi:hypothetical protein
MKQSPTRKFKKHIQTPLILIIKICQIKTKTNQKNSKKLINQKNSKKLINNVINKSKELKKI